MCVSKVRHMMGRKTGFFRLFDFSTNVATGNRKNSEFVQPQRVVRPFAVGFSPISVFFSSPANWTCEHYSFLESQFILPSWVNVIKEFLVPIAVPSQVSTSLRRTHNRHYHTKSSLEPLTFVRIVREIYYYGSHSVRIITYWFCYRSDVYLVIY